MGLSEKEKQEMVFNKRFLISAFRGNQKSYMVLLFNLLTFPFSGFDKNGDGTVSLSEFKEVALAISCH